MIEYVSPPDEPHFANAALKHEYEDRNLFDEIAWLFPQATPTLVRIPGWREPIGRYTQSGDQIHHIAGACAGMSRWDIVTNIIRLSKPTHDFCERWKFDGFAICMADKLLKGEWDPRRMAEIMHVDSVDGWLETKEFQFPWTAAVLEKCRRMAVDPDPITRLLREAA